MKEFINKTMQATRQYTILDFALLKNCLIAIGVILGVYIRGFLAKYIFIVWAAAIISYVWIMYKTFIRYWK